MFVLISSMINLAYLLFVLFFFLAILHGLWTSAPRPGIELRLPAVQAQSPNPYATRELPYLFFQKSTFLVLCLRRTHWGTMGLAGGLSRSEKAWWKDRARGPAHTVLPGSTFCPSVHGGLFSDLLHQEGRPGLLRLTG